MSVLPTTDLLPPVQPSTTRPVVVLVGALDTKGAEYGFVRDRLAESGVGALLVDVGVRGDAAVQADVDRDTVAVRGGTTVEALARAGDRGAAMTVMADAAAGLVRGLVVSGAASGLMVLGGSNAGFVMSRLAPALPIGVPKVLVATITAGDTRPYVGTSDLTMVYPVVDIAGLNSISRLVLARAADACAGMVTAPPLPPAETLREAVGCTMFGVTTACVTAVQHQLVEGGREVHVFHANGTGGRTLEAMIASGLFAAVADLTTTELADELTGGVCSAGPGRLTAAAAHGVPQVVSVGAMDMANFGAAGTVPPRYADRLLYPYHPAVTLMRTDRAENEALGRELAEKVSRSTGYAEVHVPTRGFSQLSVAGAPFHDPTADRALVASLREHLDPRIPLHLHDTDINDPGFASEITRALDRALDHPRGETA